MSMLSPKHTNSIFRVSQGHRLDRFALLLTSDARKGTVLTFSYINKGIQAIS